MDSEFWNENYYDLATRPTVTIVYGGIKWSSCFFSFSAPHAKCMICERTIIEESFWSDGCGNSVCWDCFPEVHPDRKGIERIKSILKKMEVDLENEYK